MTQKLYKVGTGVGVMVLNEKGQLLLGHRPHDSGSEFGQIDSWALIGGKLEYGETFEQAAAREAMEEAGIKVVDAEVKTLQSDINDKAHFVTAGLVVTKFEGEPKVTAPDEIDRWEWFDLDSLPEISYFPSLKVIEKYKQGVFYEPNN